MSKDQRGFGSLFGKAKKWAQEELKNATRVTGSPQDHNNAKDANEDRLREIELEAERAAGTAVVDTLFPGVRRFADHQEEQRAIAMDEREQKARAERAGRTGRASASLTGFVSGELDELAVRVEHYDDVSPYLVHVDAVDATPITGGAFIGFTFELADLSPARHELVDDSMDSSNYQLFIEPDQEGWFFHPSYGPGVITVVDGRADVDLMFSGPGTDRIRVRASVDLTNG